MTNARETTPQRPGLLVRFCRDVLAWGYTDNGFSLRRGLRGAWAWWSFAETLTPQERWREYRGLFLYRIAAKDRRHIDVG